MVDKIRVSVIIPTFKRADLLIQTLESLLLQEYSKTLFEVIVVDNNSQDNTFLAVESFIQTYSDRLNIKYTIEKRQGDIYARHTGAYHADGDILIFTDDDATFDTNWITEIMYVFSKYPVGAVGTRILIKWDIQPAKWVEKHEPLLGRISFGDSYTVKKGLFINNGSLAIKKDIYKEVKGNNPGQVLNYLIGDAEVGLCRKLHERKILIGFADTTTMWHHQFVNKNGTFKDILRRVANNGIAESYVDCIVQGKKSRFFLMKNVFFTLIRMTQSIFTFNKSKIINAILKFHQLKFRFVYIKKFQKDKELMELVNKKDWLFDDYYEGSKLIFNHTISC